MILFCPHCGHDLKQPLKNGIASCTNCSRIFDSTLVNKILSAAWLVRRKGIIDPQYLVDHCGLEKENADLVISFIVKECYSPEEFYHHVKEKFLA